MTVLRFCGTESARNTRQSISHSLSLSKCSQSLLFFTSPSTRACKHGALGMRKGMTSSSVKRQPVFRARGFWDFFSASAASLHPTKIYHENPISAIDPSLYSTFLSLFLKPLSRRCLTNRPTKVHHPSE